MKWFETGGILFGRWGKLNFRKCTILFVPFILFLIFTISNFILFGLEYIFTFPVEASGFESDSKIKGEEDTFVKISKIVHMFFLFPCIVFCKLVSIVLYIPISIFALWYDAMFFLICDDWDGFVLSKNLLKLN